VREEGVTRAGVDGLGSRGGAQRLRVQVLCALVVDRPPRLPPEPAHIEDEPSGDDAAFGPALDAQRRAALGDLGVRGAVVEAVSVVAAVAQAVELAGRLGEEAVQDVVAVIAILLTTGVLYLAITIPAALPAHRIERKAAITR
jgi:hypothetical protein